MFFYYLNRIFSLNNYKLSIFRRINFQFIFFFIFLLGFLLYFCFHPELRNKEMESSFFGEKAYNIEESPYFCQKANGLSSIFYFLPPLYVLLIERIRFEWTQRNLEFFIFVLVSFYNGIGNLSFHAFCLPYGLSLDGSGMIYLISFFVSKTFQKLFFNHDRYIWLGIFWFIFCVQILLFDPFLLHIYDISNYYSYVIPLIIFVEQCFANTIEHRKFSNIFGILSLIFFVVGYVFWLIDEKEIVKIGIESLFQFHSLWHIFTSLSILFLFKMYMLQDIFTLYEVSIKNKELRSSV